MKNKIVIALTFSLFCFTSAYAKNNNIPDNTVRYDTIAEQAYQKFKSEKPVMWRIIFRLSPNTAPIITPL